MADVKHVEKTSIPFRTKIPNLMLVGQNIGLHGVLGVSINAVAVCGELIGLDYLLEKINKTSV
jgi:all-trans-retinol 13,14-reductase